jgi:3-deoxy-D-arabino-heptulosonate 7-phosphate (DAHP) synthase
VVDGPSPTPTTTNQDRGEATLRGGSIKARTSPASTSGSPSFEDHRRHE